MKSILINIMYTTFYKWNVKFVKSIFILLYKQLPISENWILMELEGKLLLIFLGFKILKISYLTSSKNLSPKIFWTWNFSEIFWKILNFYQNSCRSSIFSKNFLPKFLQKSNILYLDFFIEAQFLVDVYPLKNTNDFLKNLYTYIRI